MERYEDLEVIELGVATEQTKGGTFVILDASQGRDLVGGGISDD